MRRALISTLIERLEALYPDTYIPYGTSNDEVEGTGFRILDIPATFSVLTFGDIPEDRFNIQIESFPPGDYIYNKEVSLEQLMELIEVYRKPIKDWP